MFSLRLSDAMIHAFLLFICWNKERKFFLKKKKRKPKLTEGFMPGIPRGEEREARASE